MFGLLLDDALRQFKDFFVVVIFCCPFSPPALLFPLDVEISTVQELTVEKSK